MRSGVLFLAFLLASTISAATQFKFVTESTGDRLNPRSAGTVRVEGLSYRTDGDPESILSSASFSTDGGKTVTVLNQKLSTYYRVKVPAPRSLSSQLYDVPFMEMDKSKVSVKDVVLTEEPTDERIAGYETKKYVLTFAHDVRYTIQGEKLRVLFSSTVLLWTTEAIDLSVVPMDPREIRTGHDAVDLAVKEALSGVKGFPLQRRMSVTRRYEGGQVMVDVGSTTFDDFKTVDLPPAALAVPSGYRYEEPVMLFPGAQPRD
jgi:hypothetical protein